MKMSSTLNIYKHLQQENNANYVLPPHLF